jgi:hypothetical protein
MANPGVVVVVNNAVHQGFPSGVRIRLPSRQNAHMVGVLVEWMLPASGR